MDQDQVNAMKHILEEKTEYTFTKYIAGGAFGQVIAAKGAFEEVVAVKFIKCEHTSAGEILLWKELNHPNVLQLLDMIMLSEVNLFVTPLLCRELWSLIEDHQFRMLSDSFGLIKRWLKDVLAGIMYLHGKKLCHLDLKTDNVLIDAHSNAVISDFSALSMAIGPVTSYVLPKLFQPPETNAMQLPVDGYRFDIWSFGILSLNVFSGHHISRRIGQVNNWHSDVFPVLKDALQFSSFKCLVSSTYHATHSSDIEVSWALNFVKSALRVQPRDRPSASALKDHILLDDNVFFLSYPDEVWYSTGNVSQVCCTRRKQPRLYKVRRVTKLHNFKNNEKPRRAVIQNRKVWKKSKTVTFMSKDYYFMTQAACNDVQVEVPVNTPAIPDNTQSVQSPIVQTYRCGNQPGKSEAIQSVGEVVEANGKSKVRKGLRKRIGDFFRKKWFAFCTCSKKV